MNSLRALVLAGALGLFAVPASAQHAVDFHSRAIDLSGTRVVSKTTRLGDCGTVLHGSHGYLGSSGFRAHVWTGGSRTRVSIRLGTDLCDPFYPRTIVTSPRYVCHPVGCGCVVCCPVRPRPIVICDDPWPVWRTTYTSVVTTPVVTQPVIYPSPPPVVYQAVPVQAPVSTPPAVSLPVVPAEPATPLEAGRSALRRGEAERAIRLLKEHLRDPAHERDGDTQRLLALALLSANRADEAAVIMRKAYRTDAGLVELPFDPVVVGEDDRRIRALTVRAVEFANREKSAEAWFLVSVLMQAQNRLVLARTILQRAVDAGLERQIAEPMSEALGR
jgi:hypothetical protein